MDPKVSVIMPVYNTEEFLPECLDSLLSQTLREIEIICVDDGSTDGSLAVLKAYAEKDPRIQVLTQQNQYAGVARNHGLRYAKGKYVSFLDSDDFFAPDMLEKVSDKCEAEQSDICVFLAITYNQKTGETEGLPRGFRKANLPENRPFSAYDMPDRAFITLGDVVSTKMIRRAFIEEEQIQFLPLVCTNDHYFSYVSVACAKRISVLDEVFYYHRLGQEGNTRTKRNLHPLSFYDSWKEVAKTLQEKGHYQALEQGLTDALLRSSLSRVRHFIQRHDEHAFLSVYEAVRQEILPTLKLEERGRDYFSSERSFTDALTVQQETPIGFLFYQSEKNAETLMRRKMRIVKLIARKDVLKAKKEKLKRDKRKLERELARNQGIMASPSYRIGRVITAPGRVLRRVYYKLQNKENA